ncbi:hypothetical protein PR048_024942 [Dryococelus australis]|uniref:Uncharacterized protein n=1 Tax=Dryococelus australis TaxID=614101 RepID=A0ABQ9GQ25_9NEOP|nr:hypothetical protein PR048_024942 [Dryococelus australis]
MRHEFRSHGLAQRIGEWLRPHRKNLHDISSLGVVYSPRARIEHACAHTREQTLALVLSLAIDEHLEQHSLTSLPGATVSLLAFHRGEPGSIPGPVTGLSQVGIVPDDAVGRGPPRGSPHTPPPPFFFSFRHLSILTSITLNGSQDLVGFSKVESSRECTAACLLCAAWPPRVFVAAHRRRGFRFQPAAPANHGRERAYLGHYQDEYYAPCSPAIAGRCKHLFVSPDLLSRVASTFIKSLPVDTMTRMLSTCFPVLFSLPAIGDVRISRCYLVVDEAPNLLVSFFGGPWLDYPLTPRRTGFDSRRSRSRAFSHEGIVLDDAAVWRVFSGISRSGAAPYSPSFTFIGSQDLHVKTAANEHTPETPSIHRTGESILQAIELAKFYLLLAVYLGLRGRWSRVEGKSPPARLTSCSRRVRPATRSPFADR